MLSRQTHQRQMTLMQITHGRYKSGAQLAAQLVTQLVNRGDDFHEDLGAVCAGGGFTSPAGNSFGEGHQNSWAAQSRAMKDRLVNLLLEHASASVRRVGEPDVNGREGFGLRDLDQGFLGQFQQRDKVHDHHGHTPRRIE